MDPGFPQAPMFRGEGFAAICTGLQQNTGIRILDVTDCSLLDEHFKHLGQASTLHATKAVFCANVAHAVPVAW